MAVSDEFKHAYRYGTLVIWPPDDLRATVNVLRQRYDPASQAICDAHITLTQPFLSEPTDSDLTNIDEVVAGFLPMEIDYGPLGTFLPYPCVYLAIRPAEPLRALQADLYALGQFDLSAPHSDPDTFVFHVSITDGYPDAEQTALICDALTGSEPTGSFLADSVTWIKPDAAFRFRKKRVFRSVGQ